MAIEKDEKKTEIKDEEWKVDPELQYQAAANVTAVNISAPIVTNLSGAPLQECISNETVLIKSTVTNLLNMELTFTLIIEIRDKGGNALQITYGTGKLPPKGDTAFGFSWLPKEMGKFNVRAFVINSIDAPSALSSIVQSFIHVKSIHTKSNRDNLENLKYTGSLVYVNIVSRAKTKGDQAFSPNPVVAKIGDTVIWINNDDTLHTVTSGMGGNADGKFGMNDDGTPILIQPNKTFQYTVMGAGTFPYFCSLYPTMVGTLEVNHEPSLKRS